MTKEDRYKLYDRALNKWGLYSQYDQLLEEMGELIVAINKMKRANIDLSERKDEILNNFIEEICDTKMCLEQMEHIFGEEKINAVFEAKLHKLKNQLDK